MRRFKYIKISKSKKIRYLTNYYKKNLYIIFLHGFMSDLEGQKPLNFQKFSQKKGLGFLGIEYSGHGKSSGKFTNGNISQWTNEVKIVIKKFKLIKRYPRTHTGTNKDKFIFFYNSLN